MNYKPPTLRSKPRKNAKREIRHDDTSARVTGATAFVESGTLSALALATVRRAQLTAFWNAPRAAHEFALLAAIERGWRELAHECGRRQLADGGD